MDDEKRVIRGPNQAEDGINADTPRILVPSERVISRNAGCWNCAHARDATTFWFGDPVKGTNGRRDQDLQRAVQISLESQLGENHPKAMNIKRMVVFVDNAVRQRAMILCGGGGKNANGDEVGLAANSFMCSKYRGTTGASLAREGERINDVPEEIRERLDGPDPSARLQEIAEEIKK